MSNTSQMFYENLKTEATRKSYKIWLEKFFAHANTDYDHILALSEKEIKLKIRAYVSHLNQLRKATGSPSPNSFNSMMTPIQSYLEQNEIEFSWKNIKRSYPDKIPTSNKLSYTDEDILELLGATTSLRNKAVIHFLASSGCRVGAIKDILIEDVREVEDGAVVTVYRDTIQEYKTCLTPEAYTALKKYLKERINRNPEAVLFTRKNNITPLTQSSAQDIVRFVRKTAKLSVDDTTKCRKAKSQNHAFRKRFKQTLAYADVQSDFIEYMMGHYTGNSLAYFSEWDDKKLYTKFKKAIPVLTLDKSEKLESRYKDDLEQKNQEYKKEFKDKIESLEGQLVEMKKDKSKRVLEFYDDLAEKKGADKIEEIKTKLDDVQISEIKEARETLGTDPLEITNGQDMLRRKYLVSKQESTISSLEKELEVLAEKVPKRKSPDKMTDKQFEALEEYEDKLLEIELAQEFLKELKKKV